MGITRPHPPLARIRRCQPDAVLGCVARRTKRHRCLVSGDVLTDVTRREDLERLVRLAVEQFGRIEVVVSNAGISTIGPLANLDVDGWSATIDVNLRGVLHGIAATLAGISAARRGNLVTTVSTCGLKIVPTQAVYAATKNAVGTLREALRRESTDGVLRTTSVSPGMCAPSWPTRSRTPCCARRYGA